MGASIRVKVNVAEVLRRELAPDRSWRREPVAIGAATDPYQPAEGRYRLTRACLQALGEAATPVQLITRGPMIVARHRRAQEAARRADRRVTFSVPTLDHEVWQKTEPGTAPPRQRLRALNALIDAGIKAGVGLAPILPGMSDRPEQLAEVVRAARDAGAAGIWARLLYLPPGTRSISSRSLRATGRSSSSATKTSMRQGRISRARRSTRSGSRCADCARHGVRDRRKAPLAPPPEPVQLSLGV